MTLWLQGYAPKWTFNDTVLTCTPKSSALPASAIISIAASVAGALLLAAVGLLVWLRLTVQLRPKWQREKQLLANRKKGVPCGTAASIVVTDVEQYSSMMQVNPQLTTHALGGFNARLVVRARTLAESGCCSFWSTCCLIPFDFNTTVIARLAELLAHRALHSCGVTSARE